MAAKIDDELAQALRTFVGQERVNALLQQSLSEEQVQQLRDSVGQRQHMDMNELKAHEMRRQAEEYEAESGCMMHIAERLVVWSMLACLVNAPMRCMALHLHACAPPLPHAAALLREQLAIMGVTPEALSAEGRAALTELAQAASALGLTSTTSSTILAGWVGLSLEANSAARNRVGISLQWVAHHQPVSVPSVSDEGVRSCCAWTMCSV